MAAQGALTDRAIVPAWAQAPGVGPRYVHRPEWFGALVYDRETCQYMPYDARAAALLLGAAPADEAERAFAAGGAREGLLDAAGRPTARVTPARAAPGRLSAPLTVYLGATAGCNLACQHCQADAGGPAGAALPLELARSLFRDQAEAGCMQVHVTGGEPTLHPALLALLDAALGHELNVLLTTNGLAVTPALAEALADRALRCVSVSVDGADAASNDALRGAGAFEGALRGLGLLARHGPVGVTATFTPALAGRLEELARRCVDAGAASLTLRPALPAGRAARKSKRRVSKRNKR